MEKRLFSDMFTFSRSSPASYIRSDGRVGVVPNDIPRFAHDPKNENRPLGVMLENSSKNIVRMSNDLSSPSWSKEGQVVAEYGVQGITGNSDASRITSPQNGNVFRAARLLGIEILQKFTLSYDIKYVSGSPIVIIRTTGLYSNNAYTIKYDCSTGEILEMSGGIKSSDISIIPLYDGWFSVRFFHPEPSVSQIKVVWFDPSYSGESVVDIQHVQIEEGHNQSSSRITTNGTEMTRESDKMSFSVDGYFNQSVGTWVIDGSFEDSSALYGAGFDAVGLTGEGCFVFRYDASTGGKLDVMGEQVNMRWKDSPPSIIDVNDVVGQCTVKSVEYFRYALDDDTVQQLVGGNISVDFNLTNGQVVDLDFSRQRHSVMYTDGRMERLEEPSSIVSYGKTGVTYYRNDVGVLQEVGVDEYEYHYTDGECRGIHLGASTRNDLYPSNEFTGSIWSLIEVSSHTVSGVTPMGDGQYEVITQDKPSGFRTLRTLNRNFVAGKIYTISTFFRNEGSENAPVTYSFNLRRDDDSDVEHGAWEASLDMVDETVTTDGGSNGVQVLNVDFEKYINNWYRFNATFTLNYDSSSNINKIISFVGGDSPNAAFGVWGVMLNEGRAAPYIPTQGSTVTVPHTLLNVYDLDRFLSNTKNGVVLVEFETVVGVDNNSGLFELREKDTSSPAKIRQYIAGDTPEDRVVWQYTGTQGTSIGMGQPSNQSPTTMTGFHRVATSFDMIGNNVRHQAAIDGVTGSLTDIITDGLFDVGELYVSALSDGGAFKQSIILRKIEVYSIPKWHGDLAQLTSVSTS